MQNLSRSTTTLLACTVAALLLTPTKAQAVKSVGDLKNIESQVQKLVDKALPCVVCVVSARGGGSGSGVTVSADGLVLTAAHVTQAAGEDLFVIFPDGRRARAKSLGANRLRDAAMVQITEAGPFPFVDVGKSETLERNDWCISLGHAGGFQAERTPPVRLGRVLANGRFVVTDCTIIGGDSGGPLFDLQGDVIGIHSNIGESLTQNQHVPIDVFTDDWDRMERGETWGQGLQGNPNQVIMGVQLSSETNDDGVILAEITPDAPAAKAGLEAGDIVVKINGKKMETPDDVISILSNKRPGDKVKLKIKRGDEMKNFEVRLIRASQLRQRGRQPQGRQRRRRQPPSERSEQRKRPPLEDGAPKEDTSTDDNISVSETPAVETKTAKESESAAETPTVADQENADDKDAKEDSDRSVEELMREARRNGGRLELTQKERERLQDYMRERFRNQGGRLGRILRAPSNAADEWYADIMQAYEPVVAIASDSTYPVFVDGKQVALGTAVTTSTLLTKASEIDEQDFQIQLKDGKRVDAKVVSVFKRYDLALIQVSDSSLNPTKFSSDKTDMPLGTFVASVNESNKPSAIGLVSVKTRELALTNGFLGVLLDKPEDDIIIRQVLPQSPAEKAELKVNDVILKLNKESYEDLQELIKAVGSYGPDHQVILTVRRGDEELEITATLGKRAADPRSRIERMNQMGGELSQTRSGFPLVLQHDCAIEPFECGGPLVNLDGEVVGINIARAGRIKSYALPAHAIQELLAAELTSESQPLPVQPPTIQPVPVPLN